MQEAHEELNVTWYRGARRRALPSVLIVYTGGTIGAVPSDLNDPSSPLGIAEWPDIQKEIPEIGLLDAGVDAVALDHPLDSTNMQPRYWTRLVEIIEESYDTYAGFVILHGTDTMVYTASALSFMLRGLEKPVILTGSQIPILGHPDNDGEKNLVRAVKLAYTVKVPEVCIFFDRFLLRGNRAIKSNAMGFAGFSSPNFPHLAEFGEHISQNEHLFQRARGPFSPLVVLDPNVASLLIFPGIQEHLLAGILTNPELKGIVMQAYGTGNAPSTDEFLGVVKRSVGGGKVILDVTQCAKGQVVLGQYETGAGLLERGVLSGADMTAEAALCKLMVLLANTADHDQLHAELESNLAGEQSQSLYRVPYEVENTEPSDAGVSIHLVCSSPRTGWDKSRIRHIALYLFGTVVDGESLDDDDKERILEIDAFVGLERGKPPKRNLPSFAGTHRKRLPDEPTLFCFDLTAARTMVSESAPAVSLISRSRLKWNQALLLITTREFAP